ncbi:MAG: BrnT family toxin [Candidatus Korobacteraceae bacterium]
MKLTVVGFDWDSGNHAKCQSHGVSIAEIEELFAHAVYVAPVPIRPDSEDRFIATGRNRAGRPLFVAFTLRTINNRQLIRPISARYMHAKEIAAYEKASPETEDQ